MPKVGRGYETLHNEPTEHFAKEAASYLAKTRYPKTALEKKIAARNAPGVRAGDDLVEATKDLFHNGMGLKWGDDQITVFYAFLTSCLALIYGATWGASKARVMRRWKIDNESPYTIVNMARRNGKTFVTAGTAAALVLTIPNIKIAIFSTCKRTSQLMMTAILEQIERAFEAGTKVKRQDFRVISRNMEQVIYEGPDGTRRQISSYPGSVRVSNFFVFF